MLEYIDNENVAILYFFSFWGGFYDTNVWGDHGLDGFPVIIESSTLPFGSWFGITGQSPRHVFLDHEFNYYGLEIDHNNADDIIDEMLENLE